MDGVLGIGILKKYASALINPNQCNLQHEYLGTCKKKKKISVKKKMIFFIVKHSYFVLISKKFDHHYLSY